MPDWLRRLITGALLVFVAVSVVWAYAGPRSASGAAVPASEHASDAALLVYYFHGNRRCATCEGIEAGARRAVAAEFAAELRAGELELVTRNTDQPEHAHYVEEFGLVASSLVVATPDGASYRVLDRVWGLVGNDAAFDAYVADAVRAAHEGRW